MRVSISRYVGAIYAVFLVTALACAVRADVANYAAFRPTSAASTELNVAGIPFLKTECWNPAGEGESFKLDLLGLRAESLYILGGINSVDKPHPDWGTGDSY